MTEENDGDSGAQTQSLDDIAAEMGPIDSGQASQEGNTQHSQGDSTSDLKFEMPAVMPDPVLEKEAHQAWLTRHATSTAALVKQVQGLQETLRSQTEASAEEKQDQEINGIVGQVASEIGAEDRDLVEIGLALKFKKDASFQHIWNNRDKNPAAFKKALTVVGNELKERLSIQADPQQQANQSALDQALNKGTGKKAPSPSKADRDFELANLPEDQFWAEIQRVKGGAYG